MPNKTFVYWMAALGLSVFGAFAGADEVLGHISDETEPKTTLHSQAEDHANSDRKIIYRVICSPEDEQLPDCEKPFHDVESVSKPQALEKSAEQPQEGDVAEPASDDQPEKQAPAVKSTAKTQQKSTVAAKKQPDSKKSKPVTKNSANKTKTTAKKSTAKPAAKKAPAKKK